MILSRISQSHNFFSFPVCDLNTEVNIHSDGNYQGGVKGKGHMNNSIFVKCRQYFERFTINQIPDMNIWFQVRLPTCYIELQRVHGKGCDFAPVPFVKSLFICLGVINYNYSGSVINKISFTTFVHFIVGLYGWLI